MAGKRVREDLVSQGGVVEELCHGLAKRLHTMAPEAPDINSSGHRHPLDPLENLDAHRLVQHGSAGYTGAHHQQHHHQHAAQGQLNSDWPGGEVPDAGQSTAADLHRDDSWQHNPDALSQYEEPNKMLRDLHFARVRRQSIAPGHPDLNLPPQHQ